MDILKAVFGTVIQYHLPFTSSHAPRFTNLRGIETINLETGMIHHTSTEYFETVQGDLVHLRHCFAPWNSLPKGACVKVNGLVVLKTQFLDTEDDFNAIHLATGTAMRVDGVATEEYKFVVE